jgi:quercetin dioxygenase-like cupin family protein
MGARRAGDVQDDERETGGAYSLFEVTTQPGGRVLAHVQHREDESFYVLEGEYEFLVEGRTLRAARARSSTSPGATCTLTRTSVRW